MNNRYLGSLGLIVLLFCGCSSRPSDKEITKNIRKTFSCCGFEEDFKVDIAGVAKDADNLATVIAKVSLPDSFPQLKVSYAKTGTYKYSFKKYDRGWLIEKTESQESVPEEYDVYRLVALLKNMCSELNQNRNWAGLRSIRMAMQVYYGDKQGAFPTDLNVLVPKYLTKIPEVIIGSVKTSSVKNAKDWNGDCSGVTNSGGWIYANNPKNAKVWGSLAIDSNALSPDGKPWCTY